MAMKQTFLARLSSTTLLAFVFLYSIVYLVQIHLLLPEDGLPAGDPYEVGGHGFNEGERQRIGNPSRSSDADEGRQEFLTLLPGLSLAAGQTPPSPLHLNLTGQGITLATWVKPKRQHAATHCIASLGKRWALALNPDGCITFGLRNGLAIEFTTLLVAPISVWTHVTVSYTGHGAITELQASDAVSIYINGTSTAFFSQASQEWAVSDFSNDTNLQLAACPGFNGTSGASAGQWIGWLAGTLVVNRVIDPTEGPGMLDGKPVPGTIYALSVSPNSTAVPNSAALHDVVEQFSKAHTCALPSPNTLAFYGVPKSASLTAMAWVQLADAPRHKEACILSHGSWEKGWKLSMCVKYGLFTVRTMAGDVRDYFSKRMESNGDWQHVAVAYDAMDVRVQFYINGFPVEPDKIPKVLNDRDHPLSDEAAILTVGRCQAGSNTDEELMGDVADIVLWSQALDFLAVRMVLHRGLPAAHPILRRLDPSVVVIFATPSGGCQFRLVNTPTFAEGWKPMLQPSSAKLLDSAQQLLHSTIIVTAPTDELMAATRTLQFIDAELSLILRSKRLRIPTVVLASNNASLSAAPFRHLNVTVELFMRQDGSSRGYLQGVAAAASHHPAEWVLIVTISLNPMEYWLWNLMVQVLDKHSQVKAAKSLTLSHAGKIKSAGLRHQLTIVGDGRILKQPYMLYRGYPVNYLAGIVDLLPTKVEATSCESLLVGFNELLTGASKVPEDMDFFYQCGALTLPLVRRNELRMAWNSWVLDKALNQDWNSNSDSMLRFHEVHKNSAETYSMVIGPSVQQTMVDDIRCNLTVKWMFACGGSWAWEAANMIEHLDRKLQLRVQIQKPFHYCDGHNVLGAAAASFGENIERMMHLPSLQLQTRTHELTEEFHQDDIVVFHRDYFRATNWMNPWIQRPKYLIGRYMNEVTSLHGRLVEQCNILDEVWVPSKHHVEIFVKAGVARSKLVVIPESLDTNFFHPNKVQPLLLPGRKSFVFLSNFKFEERKNWKALIWAFCDAFSNLDDVSLYIHTNLRGKFNKMDIIMETIHSYIDLAVIAHTMHKDKSTIPHIALTGRPLSTGDMMSLYKASDAFVLPTHGEGWGLPLHEAMSMELPTISTAWGGNTQFMTSRNSYLIQVRDFEPSDEYDDWLRNMKWAKPDEHHLSKLMREVYDHPARAKAKGRLARQDIISRYSNEAVANMILQRFQYIEKQLAHPAVQLASTFGLQFQWTIASDVKICSSMPSAKSNQRNVQRSTHSAAESISNHQPRPKPFASLGAFCSSEQPVKVAFITPYPPRHDGLSNYAAHLRASLLDQCTSLQIDVFAVVLDFWNVEHEQYNETTVKMKICRESYSDYEAAANLINKEYDAAVVNLKLGALGGTQCAYAICFAKLLMKPLITIVHSVTHNVDDAFQATMLHTLAQSNAAVVFSERARIELDTAIGYLPAESNILQVPGIHVIPHGAHVLPAFPDKEEKKILLGLKGKTVLLTLGYQGPDKGIEHAMRGIAMLPNATKEGLIYLVVGQPADCGQLCVDHHSIIEQLASELNLRNQVLKINEHLSEDAFETVMQAADIYLAIYPDDLFPHPATFYDAMGHGCAILATPFKAALSHMPPDAGSLIWDRAPDVISRQLLRLVESPDELHRMQTSAWNASKHMTWQHAGKALLHIVLASLH